MAPVSRRTFLGAMAAAPAVANVAPSERRVLIVDLGRACVLPESLSGFRAELGDLRHPDADFVIIPGAGFLTESDASMIQRLLARGATVLLECRQATTLGIHTGGRVTPSPYFPYVDYFWPARLKIREFQPVWFQPAPYDRVIASFAGQPVALRREVGPGTLLALGSPLGPVFLSGDPDARRWLDAATRT